MASMGIIPSTALICLLLLGCAAAPPAEQAAPPPDLRPYTDLGGDFALIDQRGKAFALESLRGQDRRRSSRLTNTIWGAAPLECGP